MKKLAILIFAILMATGSTSTVMADPGLVWESTFYEDGQPGPRSYPLGESRLLGGILESSDPLNPDGTLVLQGGTSSGYAVNYEPVLGDYDWREFLVPTPEAWSIEDVINNHVLRNEETDSEDRETRIHYTRFGSGYLPGDNWYIPNGEDLPIATVISNVLAYNWDTQETTNTVVWDGKIQNYLREGINYVVDMDMNIVVKEALVDGASYKTTSIPTYMRLEMSVDTDFDGVSDADEGGGDVNGDGILDKLQAEVASITSSEGIFTTLWLKTPTARFGNIFTVDRSKLAPLPGEMLGGNYAPMDTIYMSILTEIGGRIEMEIILPEGVNPTDFIKYGSTPDNDQAHYFFLPPPSMNGPYAIITTENGKTIVRLVLVDGGIGDIDGQANGVIIDPFTLVFDGPPLVAPPDVTAEYIGDVTQFVEIGWPITDPDAIITNDAPEGNLFPYGETIVTWTATNPDTSSFTSVEQSVIVKDTYVNADVTLAFSGLGILMTSTGEEVSKKVVAATFISPWWTKSINPRRCRIHGDMIYIAGLNLLRLTGGTVELTLELTDSYGNTKTVNGSVEIPKFTWSCF